MIAGDGKDAQLQKAMEELDALVDKVARLNGSVPEGWIINDWAVVGAGVNFNDGEAGNVMFAIPVRPMPTYQIHGLLDTTDKWILTGDNDLSEDGDGDGDDDGS